MKVLNNSPLGFRVKLAVSKKADYFVSIHADASTDVYDRGALTLCQDDSILNSKRKVDTDRLKASKQLGIDILKYYDVTTVNHKSKQPGETKYVLRDSINLSSINNI